MPLDPVLLSEDVQLLWYDPVEGAPAGYSGPYGVGSVERVSALGGATLFELLEGGGAVLVPRPQSRLRRAAVERGFTAPATHVAAAETSPERAELVPAWEGLRRYSRPRSPERVLARLHANPETRLVPAGVIVFPADGPRRLSEPGLAFARSRRAELDAFVLAGVRPPGGFSPMTLRTAALLALASAWRGAYRSAPKDQWATIETRLHELRREAESGPDARIWAAVGQGVRRMTAHV